MKMFIKQRFIVLTLVFGMLVTSCDHFEDMNQNPTTSTDMDPNLMLPTIQMYLSGERYETWRNSFMYGSDWMQLWTGEYATVEYGGKGQKNALYMSALWDRQFPREVRNISDMVERTTGDPERVNINAVSRIMKVYIFSRLTDLYGDIPYFQAGTAYFNGVLTPEYDSQEEIYNDFFLELAAATDALDPSADPVTQDVYFDGNIEKWRRFGNSLRLRLAMRLTKVNVDKAKTEAEAAIAGGVLQSNSDMVVMQHRDAAFGGGGFGGNGVSYTFFSNTPQESTFRICTTLAQQLVDTSDPRLQMLTGCFFNNNARTEITSEVYEGLGDYVAMSVPPSAFTYEVTGPALSIEIDGEAEDVPMALQLLQPSKAISRIGAPFIVMSYGEVELWMAEAAVRGWNTGATAAEHYSRALRAGVEQYEVFEIDVPDAAQLDNFVDSNPLIVGRELELINTQLWVNFALNIPEAYANWRRSGYPAVVYPNRDPGVNQSNGEIPRRMQYSSVEYLYNEDNVKKAAARLAGGDDWTERVWWDQ